MFTVRGRVTTGTTTCGDLNSQRDILPTPAGVQWAPPGEGVPTTHRGV